MTKQEAQELETLCDSLMSHYLQEHAGVSLALSGKLRVDFEDGFINISSNFKDIDYIRFVGFYSDLQEYIEKAITCINDNKGIFMKLLWSYDHMSELEE